MDVRTDPNDREAIRRRERLKWNAFILALCAFVTFGLHVWWGM